MVLSRSRFAIAISSCLDSKIIAFEESTIACPDTRHPIPAFRIPPPDGGVIISRYYYKIYFGELHRATKTKICQVQTQARKNCWK